MILDKSMDAMGRIRNRLLCKFLANQGEKGVALVESLVAVAIMGVAIATFVYALSAGSLAVRENDQEVTAQSLARTQLEYTKNYSYNAGATTYPIISAPEGYSVSVGVTSVPGTDTDIQKVTANISREGQLIMAIEDYKVNR